MNLDTTQTKIFIEDLSGDWKSLGNVRPIVKLPEIYFAPNARIIVAILLPNGAQSKQIGSLVRGCTYFINHNSVGVTQMPQALAI